MSILINERPVYSVQYLKIMDCLRGPIGWPGSTSQPELGLGWFSTEMRNYQDKPWTPTSHIKPRQIYKPPLAVINHLCHCKDASYTSERLSTEAEGTLIFYWVIFSSWFADRKDTSEPRTSTCPTASTTATATASHRRRRKPPNPWVMAWILKDKKKDATTTSWPT